MSSLPVVAAVVLAAVLFAWGAITYVYRDAPRHGMHGDQWAGIVALTGGLGFFVYLALRGEHETSADSGDDDRFTLPGDDEE